MAKIKERRDAVSSLQMVHHILELNSILIFMFSNVCHASNFLLIDLD